MKKIFAITLAFMLSFSLFISCGGKDKDSGAGTSVGLASMKKAAKDAGYKVEDKVQKWDSNIVDGFTIFVPVGSSEYNTFVYEFKDSASAKKYADKIDESGYSVCLVNDKFVTFASADRGTVKYPEEYTILNNLVHGRAFNDEAGKEGSTKKHEDKDVTAKDLGGTAVNQTKDAGVFTVTVHSILTVDQTKLFKPKPGNVFVLIRVSVKNNSDKEEPISSVMHFNYKVDGKQAELTIPSGAIVNELKSELIDGVVDPGKTNEGYCYFEAPKGSKSLELIFNPGGIVKRDVISFKMDIPK